LVIGWEQDRFNELVETVQVDITEDGADHPPLGYPAEGGMEAPILEIPSLQELRNQPEEPLIMEVLLENPEHHRMI
jgi:hypothetical protein